MPGASEAVIKGVKCVFSVFTPSFYKRQFWKIVENNRDDMRNGSIRPFFKAVGLVWITGYSINYMMVKRWQVYPKIEAVKAVDAAQHH